MAITVTRAGHNAIVIVPNGETANVLTFTNATFTYSSTILPADIVAGIQATFRMLIQAGAGPAFGQFGVFGAGLNIHPIGDSDGNWNLSGGGGSNTLQVSNNTGQDIGFAIGAAHTAIGGVAPLPYTIIASFNDFQNQIQGKTPLVVARVNGGTGTFEAQAVGNIDGANFSRTGAGVYEINYGTSLDNTKFAATANIVDTANPTGFAIANLKGGDPTKIEIKTYNAAGAAADRTFVVTAWLSIN